jgi:hypothetical protein
MYGSASGASGLKVAILSLSCYNSFNTAGDRIAQAIRAVLHLSARMKRDSLEAASQNDAVEVKSTHVRRDP